MEIHFQFYFFEIWSILVSILPIIAWKAPASSWSPSELAMFFNVDPRCFGPFGKFQDTKGVSMWTAGVSRLSFRFLWLWLFEGSNLCSFSLFCSGFFYQENTVQCLHQREITLHCYILLTNCFFVHSIFSSLSIHNGVFKRRQNHHSKWLWRKSAVCVQNLERPFIEKLDLHIRKKIFEAALKIVAPWIEKKVLLNLGQ